MRRKDKEITDKRGIEEILRKALVCRVAMCNGESPYCVPMNFCYMNGSLYLHSAKEGKKLEILRRNNRVCFEVDVDVSPITEGHPSYMGLIFEKIARELVMEMIRRGALKMRVSRLGRWWQRGEEIDLVVVDDFKRKGSMLLPEYRKEYLVIARRAEHVDGVVDLREIEGLLTQFGTVSVGTP